MDQYSKDFIALEILFAALGVVEASSGTQANEHKLACILTTQRQQLL